MFELAMILVSFSFAALFAYKSLQSWVCSVPLEVSEKLFRKRLYLIHFLAIDPFSSVEKSWVREPDSLERYLRSFEAVFDADGLLVWLLAFGSSVVLAIIQLVGFSQCAL